MKFGLIESVLEDTWRLTATAGQLQPFASRPPPAEASPDHGRWEEDFPSLPPPSSRRRPGPSSRHRLRPVLAPDLPWPESAALLTVPSPAETTPAAPARQTAGCFVLLLLSSLLLPPSLVFGGVLAAVVLFNLLTHFVCKQTYTRKAKRLSDAFNIHLFLRVQ